MHFIYVSEKGKGAAVRRMNRELFAGRQLPTHQTFKHIHRSCVLVDYFVLPYVIWAVEDIAELLQWKKRYYSQ